MRFLNSVTWSDKTTRKIEAIQYTRTKRAWDWDPMKRVGLPNGPVENFDRKATTL